MIGAAMAIQAGNDMSEIHRQSIFPVAERT
jgi:hypothetical protein